MNAAFALDILAKCLTLDVRNSRLGPPSLRDEDWLAVLSLANQHLLGPALHARWRRLGWLPALPPDVCDYVADLHRLNRNRNRALRRQMTEIVKALNRVGIAPIVLKGGIHLLESAYPGHDKGIRMMRDLDILVPAADLERAVGVLTGIGYTVADRYPDGHHAYGEFARPGVPGSVDLHTELVDPYYVLPAAEIRARANVLPVENLRLAAPSPTDRMLHHLLHAQVHYLGDYYRGTLRLNQLHEFAVLADKYRTEIDWNRIADRMTEFHLSTPLHSYLLAAERLFGLPWPLAAEPRWRAEFHLRRCLLQFRIPALRVFAVPWGNLRGALAWHRMMFLYGRHGLPMAARLRHALHCLGERSFRQILDRVFRTE